MKRIFITILLCLPFVLNAQEVRYLNENFNHAEGAFPPYGWRNIDNDGDGRAWNITSDGARDNSGNQTLAATSHTWLFEDLNPDNWLITPQLLVENDTDVLTYWFGSYQSKPQQGRVYVSTTGYAIEDFALLDEVKFNGTYDNIDRSISLKDYVGKKIYIAFRHTKMQNSGIALALDNVTGPKISPFDYDLTVSGVSGFQKSNCELNDTRITVTIENLGSQPISNFKILYQSQGPVLDEHGHTETAFSELFQETVTQTINPGEKLDYQCLTALPFSEYTVGAIGIRTMVSCQEDVYELNDSYEAYFSNNATQTPPLNTGFEEGISGWHIGGNSGSTGAPFSVGSNAMMANTGASYLAAGIYAPLSGGTPLTGENSYLSTPCMMLDETKDYRLDFFYAFRKFPVGEDNKKKLNFRLIAGTDQHDLLENPVVLFDTKLESTRPLVLPDVKAEYDIFSSPVFKMPYSGIWYIGLVIYSDEPVAQTKDEWMIFIDDLDFIDTDHEKPIDISLDKINAPYNCNLTSEETISLTVRNASFVPTDKITAKYRINNGSWVSETFDVIIESNEQKELVFNTTADLSSYRKYKIEAIISHEGEVFVENNEAMIVTENKRVKELPFIDDFEEYPELKNFEDEYRVFGSGYYSWNIAYDQTGTQTYAYNGERFLVDAYDVELFTAPNDWLVTCCLQFEKGKTYDISFAYRIERYNAISSEVKVYLTSDYDPESVIETLGYLEMQNTNHQIFKATYKAEEDHIGHLALHSFGALGASVAMFDAFSITPSGTDIPEISNDLVTIYPNPVADFLNIDSKAGAVASVELFNLLGSKVYSETYPDGVNTPIIAMDGYAEGNYLVKVMLKSGEVLIEKIIVK